MPRAARCASCPAGRDLRSQPRADRPEAPRSARGRARMRAARERAFERCEVVSGPTGSPLRPRPEDNRLDRRGRQAGEILACRAVRALDPAGYFAEVSVVELAE